MISINDPQGPNAARTLIDGQFAVAAMHGFGMDIVLCANVSCLTALAREFPEARATIAKQLRDVLACIDSGNFPTKDQPLGMAAAGQQLH